jgi:hypothetical protein
VLGLHGNPVWQRDRSVLADDPTTDHLDVLLDRDDVTFTLVSDPDGDGCDTDTHTYRSPATAATAAVNLRVDDSVPGDNSGALSVSVLRLPPAVGTETVAPDKAPAVSTTRTAWPARPCGSPRPGPGRTPPASQPTRVLVDDRRPAVADHPVDDALGRPVPR